MQAIQTKMREYIKENNLTMKGLCRAVGVHDHMVGRILRGEQGINRIQFEKFAPVVGFNGVHKAEMEQAVAAVSAAKARGAEKAHKVIEAIKEATGVQTAQVILNEDCPCSDCKFTALCAHDGQACEAQWLYVNQGMGGFISRRRKKGQTADWRDGARIPSREYYLRSFSE